MIALAARMEMGDRVPRALALCPEGGCPSRTAGREIPLLDMWRLHPIMGCRRVSLIA